MWTKNFQMSKMGFKKAEEPEIKLPIWEVQKTISFFFLNYTKAFDCVDHNKLWKILQEMGIPDTWLASWEICMPVRKQQLELDMEQQEIGNRKKSSK